MDEDCPGCGRKDVVLSPESVAALVDQIPISPELRVDENVLVKRLAACCACDALKEEVLCAFCGCFVRFRARARLFACPHPAGEKWPAEPESAAKTSNQRFEDTVLWGKKEEK